MPALFDQLWLLPSWVLSAAGAVIGVLLGLALAAPFRTTRPGIARTLPLALLVVGYAAADRFLVPAITDLGLYDCAVARDTAAKNNARYANTQPDIMTTFVGLTGNCDNKTLTFAYTTTAASQSDIDPEGRKTVETRFTGDTCGNPALRRLIARGWRVEAVYAFAADEPLVMAVEC